MKLFNYEQIYLAAKGDPDFIIKYFLKWNLGGTNWVKNEGVIVDSLELYSPQTVAEYLGLCALRSYNKDLSDTDLKLSLLPPWVSLEVVEQNPLVKLTDTKIVFIKEK